ncbi:hypothetical protein TNCV_2706621 [Trichonephila clavipes]|nr:hypothetical protein TNCV_2706621 [Trichonephila clavipes]
MPTLDRKTFDKCMHNSSVKKKEVKKKMLEMSRQAAGEAHIKVPRELTCRNNSAVRHVKILGPAPFNVPPLDFKIDGYRFKIHYHGLTIKFLLWVIVRNTKIKQQEKAGANFDSSSKARRGVMDALSTYQQLLTERKRKTQITLDAFLIKMQKIGKTEDTV